MLERRRQLLFKRSRLGKSTLSHQTIHVPSTVIKNYNLKKGDILEWYPPDTDFPDEERPNLLATVVVRKERDENRK